MDVLPDLMVCNSAAVCCARLGWAIELIRMNWIQCMHISRGIVQRRNARSDTVYKETLFPYTCIYVIFVIL